MKQLSKDIKARVAQATVELDETGGRGVLVEGDLIITAAHCIAVSEEMSPGQVDNETLIITSNGSQSILVQVLAAEPVQDIAALGGIGGHYPSSPEDVERFEIFCENTTPLPICQREFEFEFPIFIYDHKARWLTGKADPTRSRYLHYIHLDQPTIEQGASGSPVVNDTGELLGILVREGAPPGFFILIPRPHLTLPVWVVKILNRTKHNYR